MWPAGRSLPMSELDARAVGALISGHLTNAGAIFPFLKALLLVSSNSFLRETSSPLAAERSTAFSCSVLGEQRVFLVMKSAADEEEEEEEEDEEEDTLMGDMGVNQIMS